MKINRKTVMTVFIGCIANGAVAAENPAAQLSLRAGLVEAPIKTAQIDPASVAATDGGVGNEAVRCAIGMVRIVDPKKAKAGKGCSLRIPAGANPTDLVVKANCDVSLVPVILVEASELKEGRLATKCPTAVAAAEKANAKLGNPNLVWVASLAALGGLVPLVLSTISN
jgi:hypothetical protein